MSNRHLRRVRSLNNEDDEKEEEFGVGSEEEEEEEQRVMTRQFNAFALLSDSESEHNVDCMCDENDEQVVGEERQVALKYSVPAGITRRNQYPQDKLQATELKQQSNSPTPTSPPTSPLIKPWNHVDWDNLNESKQVRERLGSSSTGQLRRPHGRLIAPRKSWPKVPLTALGLTVDLEANNEVIVQASEDYLFRFGQLQMLIDTADVAALGMFIHEHPECIEGHLIMSDIIRQHSVADAAGMVEFAVYLIEKALPSGKS